MRCYIHNSFVDCFPVDIQNDFSDDWKLTIYNNDYAIQECRMKLETAFFTINYYNDNFIVIQIVTPWTDRNLYDKIDKDVFRSKFSITNCHVKLSTNQYVKKFEVVKRRILRYDANTIIDFQKTKMFLIHNIQSIIHYLQHLQPYISVALKGC